MYGGSHKFGRGGGGRGGASASKRNSFPPPPPQRPSSAARPSHSSRKPPPPSSSSASPAPATTAPPQSEESFTLVPGNPPSFAATIRLAPDLVDEIKRVESQGGAARIKFDSNLSNPLGNVIDVGGKEYRFMWAHEMGGLCDIYEERQSGEDGNGLLVESGCVWRKVNVQRVLDESTKKQVKKRSEEYEQKLKSRNSHVDLDRAIVLDQCNPPMKSQMQAFAAAEVNPRKFKPKNRRLSEPSQVGGPPKPVKSTTGSSLTFSAKGRHSTSPLLSPHNQPVSVASSFNRGNATESQIVAENSIPNQAREQENAVSSVNDAPALVSGRVPESVVHKENQGAGILDLQNYLVTLLRENPKGMSIKALEKAVGDTTSISVRKIEPILKKIATYEPPGRYVLKSAVEQESLKKSYFDNGSSPEDNNQKFVPEDNLVEVPAPGLRFAEKSPAMDVEEQVQTFDEESNMVEKIDASQHFSDLFGDDEPPVNNEASDVDVDIISDDDKEPKNLQVTEHVLSTTGVPWGMPNALPQQDGRNIDQDGYVSEDVDIGSDFLDDNESQLATVPQNLGITTEKMIASDHDQTQPCKRADVVTEQDVIDDIQPENHDFVKSGGKSKRGSSDIQFEHDGDHVKRFKTNPTQPTVSGHIESHTLGSSPNHSAGLMSEDIHETHNVQKSNQFSRDEGANTHLGVQSGYNYVIPGKSAVESLHSGRGPAGRLGVDSKLQRTNEYTQLTQECFSKYDKGYREVQYEEDSSNEKANGKFKENPLAQKSSVCPEPHHRKHSEWDNKAQSLGTSSRLHTGFSLKENGKAEFDRSPGGKRLLQRELSDLELGELRDSLPEESEGSKRQFDRVSSFKKSEMKSGTSGSQNPDLRSKSIGKPVIESGNTSFPNARGAPNNSDSLSKIKSPEPYVEDGSRPHGDLQSQLQQSRSGHAEVGPVSNKAVDHSRLGHGADVANQETEDVGYGETHKKSHVHSQREDSRQEMGSRKGKGNKSRKSNTIRSASDLTKKKKDASDLTKKKKDASDRKRDVSNTQGGINKRKRSESFSDDSFSKYEKDEPELKEPVKNFLQYNEYVQEYCEKYEPYSSLIKILERYRIDFQKLGMELERAKGTERYDEILAQIRESYRRCEMRYKRLKKIFLVLHDEMKHLRQMIEDFYLDYNKGRV
uniref:OCEL domain-containing protein n=1 Tax=Chenopodium quinoa TaxID=63459 RepID=A0A803N041_CHEQI